MYTIDVTITSDPPGAEIYSVPMKSSQKFNILFEDLGYEKYGQKEHWIGITPYRTTMKCKVIVRPPIVDTLWDTPHNAYGDGDPITMVKITQVKQDQPIQTSYQHTMELQYALKLDGYSTDFTSFPIANGTYNYADMIKEASSTPVVKHHVLIKGQ